MNRLWRRREVRRSVVNESLCRGGDRRMAIVDRPSLTGMSTMLGRSARNRHSLLHLVGVRATTCFMGGRILRLMQMLIMLMQMWRSMRVTLRQTGTGLPPSGSSDL